VLVIVVVLEPRASSTYRAPPRYLTFARRLHEADQFYGAITPPGIGEDAINVMRQALAGMLWTKQYYFFEADKWLEEHGIHALQPGARQSGTAKACAS
jgi:hypothetical protein